MRAKPRQLVDVRCNRPAPVRKIGQPKQLNDAEHYGLVLSSARDLEHATQRQHHHARRATFSDLRKIAVESGREGLNLG